MAIYIFVLDKF